MAVRVERKRWIIGGLLLLSSASIYLIQPIPCLVVRNQGSCQKFLLFPLEPPQEFTLQFLHSYDRGLVWEHYTVEKDLRIYFTGVTMQSFLGGQGLIEGNFRIEDGLGKLRQVHRLLSKLSFFFGDIADHQLVLPQGAFPLRQLASTGEIVEIRAEKKIRGKLLFKRLFKMDSGDLNNQ